MYFRLADVAFEAQDKAVRLRQQLQELQQAQSQVLPGGDRVGGAPPGSDGGGGGTVDDDGPPEAIGAEEVDTADSPYAAVAGAFDDRVMQLEIEKWQTEQSKLEAEKAAKRAGEDAREAKAALEQAQAKVR